MPNPVTKAPTVTPPSILSTAMFVLELVAPFTVTVAAWFSMSNIGILSITLTEVPSDSLYSISNSVTPSC